MFEATPPPPPPKKTTDMQQYILTNRRWSNVEATLTLAELFVFAMISDFHFRTHNMFPPPYYKILS